MKKAILIAAIFFVALPALALEHEKLTVQSAKRLEFDVEVAKSWQEQKKGLMGRKSLKNNQGMLFLFAEEQKVKMWMKDTMLPLDMIFIARGGEIIDIKQAKPYSLKKLNSEKAVIAVLEINGGLASQLSIKAGDIITGEGLQ